MKPNEAYERLCGGDWSAARALKPFSGEACAFLSDLSRVLMETPEARAYADVVTFAFFCRRSELERARARYGEETQRRLGRGMAFHIAPGNVAVNFAYSLAASLLAGNVSVVKAPSRDFAQTRLLCTAMDALLDGAHGALKNHVNVIRYPRERQEVTQALSQACDVRVVWGGDATVDAVRRAALRPQAFDVTFPDRYSLLVARAQAVLEMDENQVAKLTQAFYNDTYLTDQNACSSPRLVYWLGEGEALQAARARFWEAVRGYAKARYPLEAVTAVDKHTAACRAAIELGAAVEPMPDNVVTRVLAPRLTLEAQTHRCPGGFFVEYADTSLDALAAVCDRRCQTLTYLGLDAQTLSDWVVKNGLGGVDRIVPVGHALDFSLTWDGYDLIRTLSREIVRF